MKKLKIGLVYDLQEDYLDIGDKPKDFYAEFDAMSTVETLHKTIEELGFNVIKIGNLKNLAEKITSKKTEVDLIFNIAEGVYQRARQAQVPALLEAFCIPFVGSDALTHAVVTDKAVTKKLWKYDNLRTTNFLLISNLDELVESDVEEHIRFPAFVKPCYAGSSSGISEESLVSSFESMKHVCKKTIQYYQQPALVEPFLSGEEYTVGIVDKQRKPEVLGSLKQLSQNPNGIRGSQEKKDYQKPEDFCAPIDNQELQGQLAELALKAYNSVQCRDLARVDVRADSSGELFLMEINALVNLDVVSSLNYMASLKGISYHDLIAQIINNTCERYQMEAF